MSHTIWTPLGYDIKDDNSVPPKPGTDPKWCDGTAFRYPTEPGVSGGPDNKKQKAKPLRLTPYNQINQIRNAIVSESVRDEWLASQPLTKNEIQTFKEDIEEWQHEFEVDWEIPIGDEEYFHKQDINELRRLATYPNTVYEQDVRSVYPLLHDFCIDKMTKGMRCYAEVTNNYASGWVDYVDTLVAPVNQSHRFWIWTQYPGYGLWRGSVAGIIGLDGKIKLPIGSCDIDEIWKPTPQPDDVDAENWWLIQLVQDVHKPVEELATILKALKGRQHWMAYSWWATYTCVISDLGTPPPWPPPCTKTETWQWYDGCIGETQINTLVTHYLNCIYCPPDTYSSGSFPAEWEDMETGEDFFHTWEYYMDQL